MSLTITKANASQHNNFSILSKEDLLLKSLTIFYKNDLNMSKILPIITGTSIISLRVLDWFVTNYSKTYRTSYSLNGELFSVHRDYKSLLKSYNKKLFDPFCRRQRIYFYYKDGKSIITTIGQLNFFRWAIQSNILDYVNNSNNLIHIVEHMNTINKNRKKNVYKKNINKQAVTLSAQSIVTKKNIRVRLTFD
jgi:hypothetical protein